VYNKDDAKVFCVFFKKKQARDLKKRKEKKK